jgi:hypothetical protein
MHEQDLPRMDRRQAIKWMVSAAAALSLPSAGVGAFGASKPFAKGYGTDPNLMEAYKSGDFWPLTFTDTQRKTVGALCDTIIPADEKSPSASKLNVQDFIDEWVSAPYPTQQEHRKVILAGLAWLEVESNKRCRKSFSELSEEQKGEICNDICFVPKAAPKFKQAAEFFTLFRDLTMAGFYTTPEGWKDIQYVGNVPLTKFDGPPPEVLKYLKLA